MTSLRVRWMALSACLCLPLAACDDDDGGNTGADAGADASIVGGTGGTAGVGADAAAGADALADGGDAAPVSACAPADPNVYTSPNFATNAAVELAVLQRLDALNGKMDAAEKAAAMGMPMAVTKAELDALFTAGTPSLKSITNPTYAAVLEGAGGVFELFAAASDKTWTPSDPPAGAGGLLGVHIYAADGRDLRQMVEKGLYSAALYAHAVDVLGQATLTAADIDRVMAIAGFNPSFPDDDSAMVAAPDKYIAKYTDRRSPNGDATSQYARLERAFIDAQAAASKGSACAAELAQATTRIRQLLEQTLATTTLFYANDGATKLSEAGTDPAKQDGAIHSIGEGFSFVYGFYKMPANERTITDAQIEEVLALFNVKPGETPAPYKFLTNAIEVAKLPMVVSQIQAVYGFSAAEVETYKKNN